MRIASRYLPTRELVPPPRNRPSQHPAAQRVIYRDDQHNPRLERDDRGTGVGVQSSDTAQHFIRLGNAIATKEDPPDHYPKLGEYDCYCAPAAALPIHTDRKAWSQGRSGLVRA